MPEILTVTPDTLPLESLPLHPLLLAEKVFFSHAFLVTVLSRIGNEVDRSMPSLLPMEIHDPDVYGRVNVSYAGGRNTVSFSCRPEQSVEFQFLSAGNAAIDYIGYKQHTHILYADNQILQRHSNLITSGYYVEYPVGSRSYTFNKMYRHNFDLADRAVSALAYAFHLAWNNTAIDSLNV